MKNKYHILGNFWNGKSVPDSGPVIYCGSESIRDYTEEFDLFDSNEYTRKVNISKVFTMDKEGAILCLIHQLRFCSKIILRLDYKPSCNSQIVSSLYRKRVLQVYCFLKNSLKNGKVYLSKGLV